MYMLDNSKRKCGSIKTKANKSGAILAIALAVACIGSCRKSAPPATDFAATQPNVDAAAEADRLYVGREDLNKVRQGLVALRQGQAAQPASYELAWRLAKLNYYLGSHSPNETERDKAFRDGIDAGKLAVKLQDGKPDGHFWLGANYGGTAQASTLAGLSEIDDIKREMEAVIKLDAGYQSGSAYMVLGQVYLESPGILGGDTQKAIEFFEKGIKVGPDNALLHVHLAEAYLEAHRNGDARRQIDSVLAAKPMPGFEPEHNEAVALAHKLQEQLK
jgi:tetratricopeptide (TPR) repeat protein